MQQCLGAPTVWFQRRLSMDLYWLNRIGVVVCSRSLYLLSPCPPHAATARSLMLSKQFGSPLIIGKIEHPPLLLLVLWGAETIQSLIRVVID